ncbi:MAG TPA: DinB family protein, partial [Gemmatimonadales bacterium]|nr:DinB family protein [Gemmatimonadales bacterium]
MTPELQAMLDQIEAIKLAGQAVSVGLSEAQFNWRPGSDSWSIAECLQHLNVGVTKTLPAFDRAIGQGREQG